MLYRNRKPHDPNAGKWLGIGGKIEDGETPDECNLREVLEETGLRLRSMHFCGVIEFRADMYEDEDMYLYTSDDFEPADDEACGVFLETGIYDLPDVVHRLCRRECRGVRGSTARHRWRR